LNNRLTAAQRKYLATVKTLSCGVCDAAGPSECHEINQGQWFTSMPLCADCHRGSFSGIHGQKRAWSLRKMDEIGALNITIQRLMEDV